MTITRHHSTFNLFRWSAAVLCVCLASASCAKRPDPLPAGYFLFRVSSSEIFLNEPRYGGGIPGLGKTLLSIGHHQNYIFGRSGPGPGATPGYFLLDTQDGSLQAGLTEAEWLKLTTAAGIPSPPPVGDPQRQTSLRR